MKASAPVGAASDGRVLEAIEHGRRTSHDDARDELVHQRAAAPVSQHDAVTRQVAIRRS